MRAVMGCTPHGSRGRRTAQVLRLLRSSPARDGDAMATVTLEPLAALDWNGEFPLRTAGNDEQASSVARAGWWKAGRDQGSPLRRCFKPRPPWRAGCAGFASGCRSSVFGAQTIAVVYQVSTLRSRSGRLSGLLSGCPPTDTRPQARAKLGNCAHKRYAPA